MRVAVIGSSGQLGSDAVCMFTQVGDDVLPLTHSDIEVCSLDSVAACLRTLKPAVVVNTAAMHHVDACERDPHLAYAVNAMGARNLAIVTADLGATLIHVSTDYVFDGKTSRPYVEDDTPLPLNVYGNTKLAGEYFVRTHNLQHFVLRTSALYGHYPCRGKGGQNFIDLMLRLGQERRCVRVVDTEFVSPTSTCDLARQMVRLSRSGAFGLCHATAEGACSWYEFACEIFSAAGISVKVDVASPSEFPAKVPRPSYSVLENDHLKANCLNVFEPWQVGVHRYIHEGQGARDISAG